MPFFSMPFFLTYLLILSFSCIALLLYRITVTKKNKIASERIKMLTFIESTLFLSMLILLHPFLSIIVVIFISKFLVSTRPISMTNRPPPPTAMQTRFGYIPRVTAPGPQPIRTSTLTSRSRSISPTSTVSANSSSSHVSQRLTKGQPVSKPPPNPSLPTTTNTSKSKILTSPRPRDSSLSKSNGKSTLQSPTTASRMRSRTPSRTSSTISPTSSVASPPPPASTLPSSTTLKTDVNVIRDRYKTQKRMNFFTRHTPISTANGSPVASSTKSPESSSTLNKEKTQSSTNNSVKNKTNINRNFIHKNNFIFSSIE
jgi:hypothetical protein